MGTVGGQHPEGVIRGAQRLEAETPAALTHNIHFAFLYGIPAVILDPSRIFEALYQAARRRLDEGLGLRKRTRGPDVELRAAAHSGNEKHRNKPSKSEFCRHALSILKYTIFATGRQSS
jgi:hypothetical protein